MPKMTRDTMLNITKTYDNWLRDQELAAARAKAPADRTPWEVQIVDLADPANLHNTLKSVFGE